MSEVKRKALELADTDDATIPNGLAEILQDDLGDEFADLETDKAATPAERLLSYKELERNLSRTRPQILLSERDSDAKKNVAASRSSAFGKVSTLSLQTGSNLIDQFRTEYIPQVFNLSLPWCVGGPDLERRPRYRRGIFKDAPILSLDSFTAMIPARVESQIRWDTELTPGVWSLKFTSQVNLGMSLAIKRLLQRGQQDDSHKEDIGKATARLYELLAKGKYKAPGTDKLLPISGDISKLSSCVDISQMQQALLRNYMFMSGKVAGTRQIRREINHLTFSAQVVYGLPVFLTFTPSERHSGLTLRLTRYRRNDPGIIYGSPDFTPWIGYNKPSVYDNSDDDKETTYVELPDYDLRRLMNARDPVSCVYAFRVVIVCIIAPLLGLRMCPDCPHCCTTPNPCMDFFGSNGTPMGGSMGRADAMIGAIEAQKAEGVLHIHMFLFLQIIHQHKNLSDIANMIKEKLISVDHFKVFIDRVRCASYPDVEKFHAERTSIEKAWPAYTEDHSLCQIPSFLNFRPDCNAFLVSSEEWKFEGKHWRNSYDMRHQHVMARMNHHIHPVIDEQTGERRILNACRTKGKNTICKFGFPLEAEMAPAPFLACPCIAKERGLPDKGPRSVIGVTFPSRNEPNQNAGPTAWLVYFGDNGDVKFPHRFPIMSETHEVMIYDMKKCIGKSSLLNLAYETQVGQAAAAGYFGGYAAKMQHIGQKELKHLQQAVERKLEVEEKLNDVGAFKLYGKRIVKDLEGKGIIRTAVEATNLCLFADHHDRLMAECIRSFPSVNFPGTLLLRREEIETGQTKGYSIIAALRHGNKSGKVARVEAPFDLMYGFRGKKYKVDLHSAFEMLMYWKMTEIKHPNYRCPSTDRTLNHSKWTAAGLKFKELEKEHCVSRPTYIPGEHFEAIDADDRILLPDLPALNGLRHYWMWTKNNRPHVPVWNYSRVPKATLSPNENGRLLNVYMRPWTLNPTDQSEDNVLLSHMALTPECSESAEDRASSVISLPSNSSKRRRLKRSVDKPIAHGDIPLEPKQHPGQMSHASSWNWYINGHVVSQLSRRYINNLLAVTAARVIHKTDESSDDDEEPRHFSAEVGDMNLIQDTLQGIAMRDEEDGAQGFGRHAACIRLGRSVWESDPLTPSEEKGVDEPSFDDGRYPPLETSLKAAKEMIKQEEERPAPFQNKTEPFAHLSVIDYNARLDQWFAKLQLEKNEKTGEPEPPTDEQLRVLNRVRERLEKEFILNKEGDEVPQFIRQSAHELDDAEALRGLVHGLPGTGKSRVLKWIRGMFEEALGWEHGVQFICVAFQNRMAAAIGGNTLHNAGGLPSPGEKPEHKLSHSDVDILYSKNQNLRWILMDEISMISDGLLGMFEDFLTNAAVQNRYSKRRDQTSVIMGGYNILFFGDWWQLPPIPESSALFKPPTRSINEYQRTALNLFWDSTQNSLNFLAELTVQKRVEDPWYASLLTEFRNGNLSHENYSFLFGLPTLHAGSWYQTEDGTQYMLCGNEECKRLDDKWTRLWRDGKSWYDMQELECDICKKHRDERNRLVSTGDDRLTQAPFVDAPYVHKNNDPKFHALLLRAVEHAKRDADGAKQILWFQAQDTILNPAEVALTPEKLQQKLRRFLQYNDQKTAGIPGLFPLYDGMKVRITEKLAKNNKITILKHSPCKVVGWVLHPEDRETTSTSQRRLQHLPLCIYIKFPNAKWQVHPDMDPGVYPLKPEERQWTINEKNGTKAKRKGYTLLPDYASTSHLIQGETLDAVLAECGDFLDTPRLHDMLSAYVVLSRVKRAASLLLLRTFSLFLFQHGPPPGPHCLMKLLRSRLTAEGHEEHYTLDDAKAEFASLQCRKNEEKEMRKRVGVLWPCLECQKKFPAEAFCNKSRNSEVLYTECVALGHWRCCDACRKSKTKHTEKNILRQCEECSQNRDLRFFDEDSTCCTSCLLEAEYLRVLCRDCKKLVLLKDSVLVVNSENMPSRVCGECGPDFFKETCGVCKELKLKSEFKYKITDQQKKNGLARCIQCYKCSQCQKELNGSKFDPGMNTCRKCLGSFKVCPVCKETKDKDLMFTTIWNKGRCISCEFCVRCENHKPSQQSFKGNDNICISCRNAEQSFPCAVENCHRDLRADNFDTNILQNAKKAGRLLVCKACTDKGYSPKDVVAYECQSSGKHFAGHLNFEIRALDNFKRKKTAILICLACTKEKESQEKPCKRKRRNEDSAPAKVICHMHCDEGMELAKTEFSNTTLKNISKNNSVRCCRQCQERRDELQLKLRGTKIKCDCRGGIHQVARERCAIFHHRLSHSWPGKDCNLTLDDVQFLKRLPTNSKYAWWHKLWGRSCKAAE